MKISKTATATARRIFGLCFEGGTLDEAKLRTAVARLVEEKPREYRSVLIALQRLARLELSRRQVVVESAAELDAATRQRVLDGLSSRYGSGLEIDYKVNPSLLGGLRIRVGDDVLDGSVQGRLDRLAKSF